MRVLVTGATGFVGHYLLQLLARRKHELFAIGLEPGKNLSSRVEWMRCDIRDPERIAEALRAVRPHHIYHLAAFSSPIESFNQSRLVYETNFWGTFNLFHAAHQTSPKARILSVGSGQSYGSGTRNSLRLREKDALVPGSPYAGSKAAAEMLAIEFFRSFALPVIRVRPFNQTGPAQPPSFVCSDFARQVAGIALGLMQPLLRVGDLSVRRDFLDVRDAVIAYELLLRKGRPGDVYNVASGNAVPLRRVVDQLISYTGERVRISVDRERLRKHETKALSVDISRLKRTTGWVPRRKLESTLKDLFLYWKHELELNPKSL